MIDVIFTLEFGTKQFVRLPERLQRCVLNRITRFSQGKDPRTALLVSTGLLADPLTTMKRELSDIEIRVIFARSRSDVVALYFRCTALQGVEFFFLHVSTSHGDEPRS